MMSMTVRVKKPILTVDPIDQFCFERVALIILFVYLVVCGCRVGSRHPKTPPGGYGGAWGLVCGSSGFRAFKLAAHNQVSGLLCGPGGGHYQLAVIP